MTDIDAIRARHTKKETAPGWYRCAYDQTWWDETSNGCDTAIVLAALDDDARIVAALAEEHREYVAAAIEREARLRAAFVKRINESIGGESAARIIAMFEWAEQEVAALATEADHD